LIEKPTNLMEFSEVPQGLGLLTPIYVLDYYSYLDIGGMLRELFTEIHSLELTLRLVTKLNLVYSRSLVTNPQEESQEGFKLNFIT